MKYSKKNYNGDAGAFLFAYKITTVLKWPCRLQNIDLGIDAELEIIGEENYSLGDVIKVQIKTKESLVKKDEFKMYPEKKHIDYWKKFCLPVIFCCVDLEFEKVYFKKIDDVSEYFKDGNDKAIIVFSKSNDELTIDSKANLIKFVYPELFKKIPELLLKIESCSNQINAFDGLYIDTETHKSYDSLRKGVKSMIDEVENIVWACPWRLSNELRCKIDLMKTNLRRIDMEFQVNFSGSFS